MAGDLIATELRLSSDLIVYRELRSQENGGTQSSFGASFAEILQILQVIAERQMGPEIVDRTAREDEEEEFLKNFSPGLTDPDD